MSRSPRSLKLSLAAATATLFASALAPIRPALAEPAPLVQQGIVAEGEQWSFLDDGTDPGADWATAGYDDTTWQTGLGQFGYGDGDETTVVSYGPDPINKYATTFFRKTVEVTDIHQLVSASALLTYDDGAIIYLNGTQIHHSGNIPANHTHLTWANQNREETIPLTIDPALFINGQNTIAVEIHQAWRKSNDISFDLALTIERNDAPKPPTVLDDQAETDEAVAIGGDVSINDQAGLSYSTTTTVDPAIGAFALNANGTWTLTPVAGYLGTIVVPHQGCDDADVCAPAELTIVVDVIGDLITEPIVAPGDTWSFLDDGTDPGADWATAGYDDTTWQTGLGQFGYGDGDETTVVSYGPDPINKYATTFFRKTVDIADAFQLTDVAAELTYDDGAIIYLNGTQIHHSGNIPANHTHLTWANQNREETILLTIDPALFINGQNTIAVEIHQAWRKSNDISFDLALTGTRHILPGPPAPTVLDDRAVTPPGDAVAGDLSENDRANDDGIVAYSVDGADLPDPLTEGVLTVVGDGSFDFTPVDGFAGTLAVPHSACNDTACASGTLEIIVIDGNPAQPGLARITDPGDQTVLLGQSLDLPLDYSGPAARLTVQGMPLGTTLDATGAITGTPVDGGSYTVSAYVIVDQDQSYATAQFTVIVDDSVQAGIVAEHPAVDATGLETRPESGGHGVLGFNPDDSTDAEVRVWDMQQIGAYMYVGGEFQQVQEGDNGAIIDQAFLARFDVATGYYDATFTPALDGNVHALEVSPEGKLLVGGEFTAIDGVSGTAGLALINPATGQVETSFRSSLERPWSDNDPIVREIEVVGNVLYVGGNFSHVRDRVTNQRSRVYKVVRVNATTGVADLTWRPVVSGGSIYGIGVDQDRGRLLITGSFSSVNTTESTAKLAIVDTTTAALITDDIRASAWNIFDIEYANDLIFVANARNNRITVHNADNFDVVATYTSDGDFQFIEKIGDYIYAGCHCTQDPDHPTARVLSAITGLEVDLQFDIGGNIEGAWSVATDDRGCVWIGGDILDGGFDTGTMWARGFARFCGDARGGGNPGGGDNA